MQGEKAEQKVPLIIKGEISFEYLAQGRPPWWVRVP